MIQICFAAYSEDPSKDIVLNAVKVVDHLRRVCSDAIIFVGGYWGLMKHIVDRAIENGFTVVIVAPIEGEDMNYPEKAIVFKPGVDYRVRSVFMVRSCNALIAVGGESGTIQEIVTAYTEGKPAYVLKTGLSSDRIELLAPHIDRRALAEIKVFSEPEKLVEAVATDVCSGKVAKRFSSHG